MTWDVIEGDCVEKMREMPEASVDAVVCDPPYGLEFMGKEWDRLAARKSRERTGFDPQGEKFAVGGSKRFKESPPLPSHERKRMPKCRKCGKWQYNGWKPSECSCEEPDFEVDTSTYPRKSQEWHQAWATEALRVLKPGGFLLAAGGTRTFHRLVSAIEDAGFEIRDCIAHMHGSGFPKSLNIGEGRGTALKPSFEPWTLARKPLIGTVRANVERFGTGALNIDGCRISSGQRPTMDEWESAANLCDSCAKGAGESVKPATPATEASTAQRLVEPITNGKDGTPRAAISRTATGSSSGLSRGEPSEGPSDATNSSTDGSGSRTTAQSPTATSSTTSMRTEPTIESRTCASCGAAITSPFTTKESPSGRWPSNVALSHLPECGKVFSDCPECDVNEYAGSRTCPEHPDGPTFSIEGQGCASGCPVAELDRQSGELKAGTAYEPDGKPMERSIYGATGTLGRELGYGDTGGASRFFATFPWKYQAKASRAERNAGLEGFEAQHRPNGNKWTDRDYRVERGERTPGRESGPRQNVHPTVKPVELMRWLCRLVTPPDGTILDPFAGSGTTGIAAVLEGFDFIGIERDESYVEIAKARIAWWDTHKDRAEEILSLSAKSERERTEHVEAGQIGLFEEPAPATKAGRSTYGLRTTKTIPRCPEHDAALPSGKNAYGCGCSIQYREVAA